MSFKYIGYIVLLGGVIAFVIGLALTFHTIHIFLLLVLGGVAGGVGWLLSQSKVPGLQ